MKQALVEQRCAAIDDLLMSVEAFRRGISADFLQTVFQEWIGRLQLCCAVRAAENTLSEHYKMEYLLL
jgi:hypothetical protein